MTSDTAPEPPAEEITADDVRYGVKMLAVQNAAEVLEGRYPMQAWHPAFWVRWYLRRAYSSLLRDKTSLHDAWEAGFRW